MTETVLLARRTATRARRRGLYFATFRVSQGKTRCSGSGDRAPLRYREVDRDASGRSF
jgi:hypothetical protein